MESKLVPSTRAFDEDALQSQGVTGAYAFAMGEEKASERDRRADQFVEQAEGWKASPPVSDAGLMGSDVSFNGHGFVSSTALGGASSLKSFWGGGGWMGGMVTLELAGRARLQSPYAQDPTFFACLDKISKTVGGLPIRLEREVVEGGNTKWVTVARTGGGSNSSQVRATAGELKILDLLKRPNPLHTGRSFRTAFVQHILNDGEVLLLFMNEESKPLNLATALDAQVEAVPRYLWPVGGSSVMPMHEDRVGAMPKWFKLSDGQEWPAGSAAWCLLVTPDSATRGMGPLSPVRRKLEQNYSIDRFTDALLRNGGMPGGFFYTPERLNRDAKAAIKQSWQETQGGAQNAGKIAVIDGGAKFEPSSFKPAEMQFAELEKQNAEYVRMVMGATKPVLGITDDVNRANAFEAMRVWYEVTIKPLGDIIIDQLNAFFLDRLKPLSSGGASHRLCFDYSGVPFLREDADSKVDRTIKLVEGLGVTPRDAARITHFDDVVDSKADGLDERWVKSDRRPLEVAQDPETYRRPATNSQGPAKAATKAVESDDESEEAESARKWEARAKAAWKAFDDFVAEHEKPIKRESEKVLASYVLAARKRLVEIADGKRSVETPAAARAREKAAQRGEPVRKYVANDAEIKRALALNLAEWEALMAANVLPKIEQTLIDAAAALNLEVSGGDLVLGVTDPTVVQFMAEKEVLLAEGATSTLAKDVQAKIVKVLAGAEDATTLADAVREVLDELKDEMGTMLESTGARAERIARTETASATSFGRSEQMAIDGVEKHTWVASRDAAVRDTHASLDGKTVKVGAVFGNRLAYPGDSSHGADASEVVNCRCTTVPELD